MISDLSSVNFMAGTPYKVFIGHAWNGLDSEYYSLVNLLNSDYRFRWANYSVAQHNPLPTASNHELSYQLRQRIAACDCMLVITGMYFNHRDWIRHEIDIAVSLLKPIIGVKPWGQERIPEDLQKICKEIVNWNAASVISGIKRAYFR